MNRTFTINTRVLRIAALSITGAALLGLAAVGSAHPGPVASGVIHGCVNNSTTDGSAGNVRIVGATATCKSNESALDWHAQGPKGDKGDIGAQGPQGPSGIATLTTRTVTFPVNAHGESQKIIECNTGERATGGGFGLNSGMNIVTSQPYPPSIGTPTGWRAYVSNDTDRDGLASVFVVCAAS